MLLAALFVASIGMASAVGDDDAQSLYGIEPEDLYSVLVRRAIVNLSAGLAALDEDRTPRAVERGPDHPRHHLHASGQRADSHRPELAAVYFQDLTMMQGAGVPVRIY